MPINMAMTAEPITWMGSRLSSQQARAAMTRDNPIPGSSLRIFMGILLVYFITA
jgi:hypothetical protein